MVAVVAAASAGLLTVVGCGGDGEAPIATSAPPSSELRISSTAFEGGAAVPERYTCNGEGVSPPLSWSGVPDGADELALIVDDPDAPGGTFTHWIMWGIDASSIGVTEGEVPAGAIQGKNDFGDTAYGGPCPPSGTHRYRFEILALSGTPGLAEGASANDLRRASDGKVVGRAVLTGTYTG